MFQNMLWVAFKNYYFYKKKKKSCFVLPRNQTMPGGFFKCKGNFKNKLIQRRKNPF